MVDKKFCVHFVRFVRYVRFIYAIISKTGISDATKLPFGARRDFAPGAFLYLKLCFL